MSEHRSGFRRLLGAVMALCGLSVAHAAIPEVCMPVSPIERVRRARQRRRSSVNKGKHTQPRKGWPLLYWGDCPRPVSRKVLKRIASNHPALREAR